MTAMLPAHLTETLNNLGDLARALTVEVRAENKATRRRNRWVIVLLAVLAVLVAGLAALSVSNRRLGQANSQLNRQNAEIIEQIRSCTTVGGSCYEESQHRTGDAVGVIIRSVVYAQLCIRDLPNADAAQIDVCVQKRLAAEAKPTPAPSPTS